MHKSIKANSSYVKTNLAKTDSAHLSNKDKQREDDGSQPATQVKHIHILRGFKLETAVH